MKKFLLLSALLIFMLNILFAQQQGVSVNTTGTQAHGSAMLDVSSTEKGLLIPRMTAAQRTSISNPATGLLVYVTDDNLFWYFDGTQWVSAIGPQGPAGPAGATGATGATGPLVSGTSGQTLRHNGTNWTANSILYNNGTNVGIGTTSPNTQLHINSSSGTSPLRVQVGGLTKLFVHSDGGTTVGAATNPPTNGLYVLGSAGIGTSNPSQKLHVNGNVRFDGALMPSGSAGSSGQILVSQGASSPPAWQTPSTIPLYGNNASTVQLTSLVTNTTTTSWSNISGMTITFTPTHSVFYIFASLCARLANSSGTAQLGQAMVQVRVLVNGVEVAKAGSIITDYDQDRWGGEYVITSGSVAFSGVRANATIGQSTTVTLQWKPVILWANSPWRIEINPTLTDVADHCVLTVFD